MKKIIILIMIVILSIVLSIASYADYIDDYDELTYPNSVINYNGTTEYIVTSIFEENSNLYFEGNCTIITEYGVMTYTDLELHIQYNLDTNNYYYEQYNSGSLNDEGSWNSMVMIFEYKSTNKIYLEGSWDVSYHQFTNVTNVIDYGGGTRVTSVVEQLYSKIITDDSHLNNVMLFDDTLRNNLVKWTVLVIYWTPVLMLYLWIKKGRRLI